MNKNELFYIAVFVIFCISSYFAGKADSKVIYVEKVSETALYEPETGSIDWELFIESLIQVESEGNPKAIGSKNDVGVLQITPILLNDCNRIIGYDKYKLSDRFNRTKSIEMFNIIQNHYNPERYPHLALKLWNGKAALSYHTKVMNKYNELITETCL